MRLLAFNVTFVAQLDRFFDGVAAVSVIKAAIYVLTGSVKVLALSSEACEEPSHYRKTLEALVLGIRAQLSLADSQRPDLSDASCSFLAELL